MIIDLADIVKETIKYTMDDISREMIKYAMDDILNEVQKHKSYVGMIIASRTLDTEEKVKNFYGGEKWERIEGRTLVGAGAGFSIGTEGGEKEHALAWDEMPVHSHGLSANSRFTVSNIPGGTGISGIPNGAPVWGQYGNAHWYELWVGESGANKPHNNMPPYKVCYIWERIE